MSGTIFGYDADALNKFDAAYAASKDPRIRTLLLMDPSQPSRVLYAMSLAGKGLIIDYVIDAESFDPFMTMSQRATDGMVSVPDALGQTQIKVTTDLSYYPPFPDPPAPATEPASVYIGAEMGSTIPWIGSYWFSTPACFQQKLPNGLMLQMKTNDGVMHSFELHVNGQSYLWQMVS